MYIVKWIDYSGNEHEKTYKKIENAIKKAFDVFGWYKNGCLIRTSDGKKIL